MLGNILLKADRPHPRNHPHTLTDYRHTDNPLGLVMGVCCSLLHSAKPRSKVKRFSQESAHRRTDGQTDGRTLPSTLSPRFAVDKYGISRYYEVAILFCLVRNSRIGGLWCKSILPENLDSL